MMSHIWWSIDRSRPPISTRSESRSWTPSQRCRTLSHDPFDIDLRAFVVVPVYQSIAAQVAQMSARGDLVAVIAGHLRVDRKTVKKALRGYRQR